MGYTPANKDGQNGFYGNGEFIPVSQLQKSNSGGVNGYWSKKTGFIPTPDAKPNSLDANTPGQTISIPRSNGLWSNLKDLASNTLTDLENRAHTVEQNEIPTSNPGLNPLNAFKTGGELDPSVDAHNALNVAGQVIPFGADLVGNLLKFGYRTAMPNSAQRSIALGFQNFMRTSAGKLGLRALHGGVDEFKSFAAKYPKTANELSDFANIMLGTPVLKDALAVGGGIKDFTSTATQAARELKSGIKEAGENTEERTLNSKISRTMTKVFKLPRRISNIVSPEGKAYRDAQAMLKDIVRNKGTYDLRDLNGDQMPLIGSGNPIISLSQAMDQRKQQIYDAAHEIAVNAGDKGIKVDVGPVVKRLEDEAKLLSSQTGNQDTYNYLLDRIQQLKKVQVAGGYEPTDAENALKNINAQIQDTINPVGKKRIDDLEAQTLRDQVSNAFKDAGPEYDDLRRKYMAIKTWEDVVDKVAKKTLERTEPEYFKDMVSAYPAFHVFYGALTDNKARLAAALATKGLISGVQMLKRSPVNMLEDMLTATDKFVNPEMMAVDAGGWNHLLGEGGSTPTPTPTPTPRLTEDELRRIVEENGGIYGGSAEGHIAYTEPKSKSSSMIRTLDVTPENIRKGIAAIKARYATAENAVTDEPKSSGFWDTVKVNNEAPKTESVKKNIKKGVRRSAEAQKTWDAAKYRKWADVPNKEDLMREIKFGFGRFKDLSDREAARQSGTTENMVWDLRHKYDHIEPMGFKASTASTLDDSKPMRSIPTTPTKVEIPTKVETPVQSKVVGKNVQDWVKDNGAKYVKFESDVNPPQHRIQIGRKEFLLKDLDAQSADSVKAAIDAKKAKMEGIKSPSTDAEYSDHDAAVMDYLKKTYGEDSTELRNFKKMSPSLRAKMFRSLKSTSSSVEPDEMSLDDYTAQEDKKGPRSHRYLSDEGSMDLKKTRKLLSDVVSRMGYIQAIRNK